MESYKLNRRNFWDSIPALWNSDSEETLVCCQVRAETHDVKSFFFAAPDDGAFVFQPGQFITLELEINGAPVNRCYTISSSPARPHTISITVKRVPGGPVSNWLHDNLKAGDKVKVLPAAGEFTCATHPAEKYLFLSAGSGITPLMSMSRAHHDLCDDRDIVFIHSARTPDDIIFERELGLIAASQQNFKTRFICERLGQRRDWSGPTGMLSLAALKLMAPDFMEREIFVCGPAPYMKAVRAMLDEAGFERARYHEESFSFETLQQSVEPPASTSDITAAAGFEINFQKSMRQIICGPQQHVLEAARSAGVRLASSCAQGMCGTCKVKLISGSVDMQHKGGIRQREIDQGMVLLCCSKPLSNLVVDK
ncbi:MAG TPA: hybrid-cluster NAD(P)-dependent oxidoreductase [Collimonas sp.]|jgi:ferredoxin-NADP reductase|nr:hybrid-cluster NAD(P)-dependent oxidoreductase [Collimonas sp.]HWW08510.1 hybrid-cluster NAD(P)-dependent oxidoreductase [Collimonas sp.]